MVKQLGFDYTVAKDGEEALRLYNKSLKENPFSLVIMDLTIPGGMSGKKTMEKILLIDRNVKAIVSSGYSNDPVMANYEAYGFKAVLPKPYTLNHLKNVIIEVLNS